MDRRAFIGTMTGSLLAAPLAAESQRPGKVPIIGILTAARTWDAPLRCGCCDR
jgi:hypothetical protein